MKKKLLIILMAILPIFAYADIQKMTATSVASKSYTNGRWSEWSDWEDVNILVVINFDKERITIYSQRTQEFDIIQYYEEESDGEGGKVHEMVCVDEDGLRCHVRIRFPKTNIPQIYIDYKDFMYVYNLEQR